MANPDDQRTAVSYCVALSISMLLFAMSLVCLTLIAILFVKEPEPPIIVGISIGLILLIISIVMGGLGINSIAESGYQGEWSIISTYFSNQCMFGLFGLISIIIALSSHAL